MQTFYNYFMAKPLINYKQAKNRLKVLGKDKDKEWHKDTSSFLNFIKPKNLFVDYIRAIVPLGLGCFILSVWVFAIIYAIIQLLK